jgi:hypothetical protein
MKPSLKVLTALTVTSAVWLVVRRTVSGTRTGGGPLDATVIGGDTWPPVPVNPDRPG